MPWEVDEVKGEGEEERGRDEKQLGAIYNHFQCQRRANPNSNPSKTSNERFWAAARLAHCRRAGWAVLSWVAGSECMGIRVIVGQYAQRTLAAVHLALDRPIKQEAGEIRRG